MAGLPSIRRRLANALLGWSLLWIGAILAAVWLAADHEVDELLDDRLQASAEMLGALLAHDASFAATATQDAQAPVSVDPGARFAFQVVGADGSVLMRSHGAPASPLRATPSAGFGDTPQWRVFGLALGEGGRILYVAQTGVERREAQMEVTLAATLAALAIGLLGHVWLRTRVRQEMAPLQAISERLARHDPGEAAGTLGTAEREELQPIHGAIDELGRRLARRVANERAFAAHAAHALRTPLAGIDAQLAVALRESPADLQPRLQRVRDAAGRLQHVVAALLGLFRSGAEPRRAPVDLVALLARLPVEGLAVGVSQHATVDADADLLAAAILNLLDNARRYGATRVEVDVPRAGTVRIADDGPGVSPERRRALQAALDAQDYEGHTGLGLLLADRVARAHGGSVGLPEVDAGFAVELCMGDG